MMLVSQILKVKGDESVFTVPPSTTVAQAAEILATKRIGALIISSDGKKALGILSERDIVRELGTRGPACLKDTVDKLMTARLVTCTRQSRTSEVLEKMSAGRFRHMPVVEGGVMVGLISIGDVVKARLSELTHEVDALEGMIRGT